jgi:uncharacterized protein YcsI (UPF0317 family)
MRQTTLLAKGRVERAGASLSSSGAKSATSGATILSELTARYPHAHGAPLHAGNPEAIGIADLGRPDYGDPVAIHPGEVPVFWACEVTPQAVALEARPELMITHEPGIMFLTDLPREGDSRP